MALTAYLQQNATSTYLEAFVAVLIALAFFAFLQKFLLDRAAKAAAKSITSIDDAMVEMLRSVRPPFYWFLSVYIGLRLLALPPIVETVINGLLLAWVLYYAVRALTIGVELLISHSAQNDQERAARHLLASVCKGILWGVAALVLLSNLGINITSLIAGLGIGGVAVAFALQNILSDLFSSFAIYFDRPFEIGDFIIVGDQMGTVDRIGVKTTRVKALQGEEIVFSNNQLTSTHLQNYKKMAERRIVMDFGILYETPIDTVAALSGQIRETIKDIPDIRIDRINFAGFGDSSLNFELVYYVTSGDYNLYMDRQEAINLAIMRLFEQARVAFAYPTRTVYTVAAPSTPEAGS